MGKGKRSKVRTVTCGLCHLPLLVSGGANEKKVLQDHFKKKHGG